MPFSSDTRCRGDKIQAGDTLFIMEVMKMEVPHEAPAAGTVTAVNIKEGEEGLDAVLWRW